MNAYELAEVRKAAQQHGATVVYRDDGGYLISNAKGEYIGFVSRFRVEYTGRDMPGWSGWMAGLDDPRALVRWPFVNMAQAVDALVKRDARGLNLPGLTPPPME